MDHALELEKAKEIFEKDPSADNLIWYGRRMAYTGEYEKAIKIYSDGFSKYPKDPRILRHRGHRYITTRQFTKAISDLILAEKLIQGTEDKIEPDGIPNKLNTPVSTLHFNVFYHLGLAYYLVGDFNDAIMSFRDCFMVSENNDMEVASSFWLYLVQKRLQLDFEADSLLRKIKDDLEVIENTVYYWLLKLFKGSITIEELEQMDDEFTYDEAIIDNTMKHGIAMWHLLINEDPKSAKEVFLDIIDSDGHNSFGYLAAEVELNRIKM